MNHGIHGVMDMCSLLRQRGKAYAIAAGHIEHSDVLDRVAGYVRAAGAARLRERTVLPRPDGGEGGYPR